MSSIYKQAPSRNFSCSVVCFPFLHCSWLTQSQPASPALPSAEETEQRNPRTQTVQKIFCMYFRASEFSKAVLSAFKTKKGRDEHQTGYCWVAREWQWLKGESLLQRRSESAERKTSTIRNICWRKSQIWCWKGTQHAHLCQIPIPEVTNLIWQTTPTATIPVSALTVWVSVWWMLFKNHQPDRRTVPN